MEKELSLEKFNPTVAELTKLADSYKDLAIKGPDDKEGIKAVHAARMDLREKRIGITKTGKALREDATTFSRKVIEMEKGLVAIIAPVEEKLDAIESEIERLAEKKRRLVLLPDRKEELAAIGISLTDDQILDMTIDQYATFLNAERSKFLDRKAAALKAEEERQAGEARRLQEEKAAALRRDEEAKLADERRAKEAVEAEERKKREAVEAEARAKRDAEEVERRAKEKAEQMERERVAAEEKRKAVEAEEQARLEKEKKYQAFIAKNGVTEAFPTYPRTDRQPPKFMAAKEPDGTIALYKLIDTLEL